MAALTSNYRNVINMIAGGLMWRDQPLPASPAGPVVPGPKYSVTTCVGTQALAPHADAIVDLSARALESNPFYEPWMLSSALGAVVDRDMWFVLIFKNERSLRPRLCGFFPVVPSASHHRVPVRTFRLLSHIYCFLSVPLVDRDAASEVLQQFFSACRSRGVALVEFPRLPSGGAFHQVLVDVLHQQRLASRIENRYLRALYRVPASASSYVVEALSGRTRKHVRRQRERLAGMGALEYSTLETTSDPKAWLREFLDLEATGWKGKANTAMASSATHRQFFMEATAAALERRQMFGAALRLDGRMIAGRIGFRSSEGSYLFKIAYDEQLAAFSPGTLLELHTIEHGLPEGVEWTDSCTSPTNKAFRGLWLHSRIIEHLVVSPGRTSGDLAIGLVPLLRRIGTWMKRTPATAPTEEGNRDRSID